MLFDKVDKGKSTKDKTVIIKKLDILKVFLYDFLHIGSDDSNENKEFDLLKFVKKNVNPEATEEDIDFYSAVLDDLILNVDNNTSKINYLLLV